MKSPAMWGQFKKSLNKLAKLYLNTISHFVTNLYVFIYFAGKQKNTFRRNAQFFHETLDGTG